MRLGRGLSVAHLLVMAAFTKAPKVLRCEALDALRLNAKGFKRLVAGKRADQSGSMVKASARMASRSCVFGK